ncbi:hypothetical protein N665_0174s0028 [Sinapis alba]|nr:hypothetical protein N665_0174s0028 [Sinapis alba]
MDRPLEFSLRAQLPSGEIIPVKLVYSNLHHYCRHCRPVSHKLDSCPQLTEAERTEKLASLEEDRDAANSYRFDAQKLGENSKRSLPQAPKDRHSGEGSQRDTRDSVWKRIDSRYDPRGDPRPSTRYDQQQMRKPTARERPSPPRDSYYKWRYDESFISSKQQREASPREKDKGKGRESSPSRKVTHDLIKEDTSRKPLSDAITILHRSVSIPSVAPATQVKVSSELTRERPFRLNLQKKVSSNLKLKGKISEIDEVSDEGSSAMKSLIFEAPSDPPPISLPAIAIQGSPSKENPKSLYEMTLEEEGSMVEEELISQEQHQNPDDLASNGLPLTERILEEEDWLDEGNDFGDADGNDFGEEDADLVRIFRLRKESALQLKILDFGKTITEYVETIEEDSRSGELSSEAVDTKSRTPRKVTGSPASRGSVPSSSNKKKGGRSPTTIGVSLRQCNLMARLGSPKDFGAAHGPSGFKTDQLGPSLSVDQKKDQGTTT